MVKYSEGKELIIDGVGPDVEIIETERGGKHSASPYAFHLMDPLAMFKLAEVLAEGAKKYPRDNWRFIDVEDHLNHALQHIYAYQAGDTQDDHLGHAFCRMMMAVALDLTDKEEKEEQSKYPKEMRYSDLKKGDVFYFKSDRDILESLMIKHSYGYYLSYAKDYDSKTIFVPKEFGAHGAAPDICHIQPNRSVEDIVVVVGRKEDS